MNIEVARLGTWLVVAAIGLLGLAAAVDALRGGEEVRPARDAVPTEPTSTVRRNTDTTDPQEQVAENARRDLAEAGIEGELVLSDSSCRVRSVVLPSLEERAAPIANGCRFQVSPSGGLGADGTVPGPGRTARCIDDGVVVTAGGRVVIMPGDCPPAWTPDGRLTVVRRGELVHADYTCARDRVCLRVLLGRADLRRALGGLPWQMGDPTIREAAWLADDRVALIVHDGAQNLDALAVFRGRTLLGAPPFLYESLSNLRTSPRGSYASALLNGRALVVVNRHGEYAPPGGFRSATATAWSPDERWTALAGPEGVYIFATGSRGAGTVFVPLQATDLAWIGP